MKSKQTTVSAKVPKELKDELERKGVKLSDAIRKGLERELKELKLKDLESKLEKVDLSRVSEKQIVRDIRETREER
jgi:post-segregation antitoxin (ccd killing protein)